MYLFFPFSMYVLFTCVNVLYEINKINNTIILVLFLYPTRELTLRCVELLRKINLTIEQKMNNYNDKNISKRQFF